MVIGSVGCLCDDKNYEVQLHALALVSRKAPSVNLVLIGDGARHLALGGLARQFQFDKRVRLLVTKFRGCPYVALIQFERLAS